MAALQFLSRAARTVVVGGTNRFTALAAINLAPKRNYADDYKQEQSVMYDELDQSTLPKFETSNDPAEWKFVERLIPLALVPTPKSFTEPSPSGWTTPKKDALKLPYFVSRTKNHMQPVYYRIKERSLRHTTVIKNIDGDIWLMGEHLKDYLKRNTKKKDLIALKVNEMNGTISVRGDHVAWVKKWMDEKGF
ncbi:probable 39S ribosomal protein L49, mitochondrial [Trichogramma pretiosum]|uniref:probable 39S ribosomal protein L49, mitochondrial n=1 Tax=Trichogramma pretiosum TaxID=7493 RepID=UPI0006C995B7|nr:probable 39S ribosomal protein L49, mitochondrial [Trichogramma pretiosum]